jgi:hypothetical protein
MSMGRLIVAIALLSAASAASAQDKTLASAPPPKIFTDVVDCRTISDSTQRLACFDRTVSALAAASQNKDVFVADKAAIREARRGLFGFSLPKMRIFADDDMSQDVDSIESTIAAVGTGQRGFIFTLEDGARWAQTDKQYMDRPKIGAKIRIRRALMGSFMGRIENKSGFRIERLNSK